jgi:hypothetical protein
MRFRVLQPFQDQQTAVAGQRSQGCLDIVVRKKHVAN